MHGVNPTSQRSRTVVAMTFSVCMCGSKKVAYVLFSVYGDDQSGKRLLSV